MSDFEKWTLILAKISAVVSAISCIFAWLSARSSYLQLKENKKANVVVSFQCLMHEDVVLRVQNLGGSVAQFIGLRFEESFLNLLNEHERKTLENLNIARITLGINQSVYYSLTHASITAITLVLGSIASGTVGEFTCEFKINSGNAAPVVTLPSGVAYANGWTQADYIAGYWYTIYILNTTAYVSYRPI